MIDIIEQLKDYKRICARIQVLSTYSIGMGITISRLNEDDQLLELHRRLRRLPSYMYLNKYEQKLETTAHAYLTRYPTGTIAQKRAVPRTGAEIEDDKLLRELRDKIQKVIAARGYDIRDDIDEVLDRLSELQDLQAELKRIDTALSALESYKPDYARLLRLRYAEDLSPDDVARELKISRKTFIRWHSKALAEYAFLVG